MLRRGSLGAPLYADDHVLVLARRLGNTWALTATKNGSQLRTVAVLLPEGLPAASLADVLGEGVGVTVTPDGLVLWVPALHGRVLITR